MHYWVWLMTLFITFTLTARSAMAISDSALLRELQLTYSGPISSQDYDLLSCPRNSPGSFSSLPAPLAGSFVDSRYQEFEVGAACQCDYTTSNSPFRRTYSETFSYSYKSCFPVSDDVQRLHDRPKYCRDAFIQKYPRGRTIVSCRTRDVQVSLQATACLVSQLATQAGTTPTYTFSPTGTTPALTQTPQLGGAPGLDQLVDLKTACSCDYVQKVPITIVLPVVNPLRPLRPVTTRIWVNRRKNKIINTRASLCQKNPLTTQDMYNFAPSYCSAVCKVETAKIPNFVSFISGTNTWRNVYYSGAACYSKITANVTISGPGRVVSNPTGIDCPRGNCSVEACQLGTRVFLPSLTAIPNSGSALIEAESALWNIPKGTQSRSPISFSALPVYAGGTPEAVFFFAGDTVTLQLSGEPGAAMHNGIQFFLQKPFLQMSAQYFMPISDMSIRNRMASTQYRFTIEIQNGTGYTSTLSAAPPFQCRLESTGSEVDVWACTVDPRQLRANQTYTFAVGRSERSAPTMGLILDGDGTGRVDAATGASCQKNGPDPVVCHITPDTFYVSPGAGSYVGAKNSSRNGLVEWEFSTAWGGAQHFNIVRAENGDTLTISFQKKPTEAKENDLIVTLKGTGKGHAALAPQVDALSAPRDPNGLPTGVDFCEKTGPETIRCIFPAVLTGFQTSDVNYWLSLAISAEPDSEIVSITSTNIYYPDPNQSYPASEVSYVFRSSETSGVIEVVINQKSSGKTSTDTTSTDTTTATPNPTPTPVKFFQN